MFWRVADVGNIFKSPVALERLNPDADMLPAPSVTLRRNATWTFLDEQLGLYGRPFRFASLAAAAEVPLLPDLGKPTKVVYENAGIRVDHLDTCHGVVSSKLTRAVSRFHFVYRQLNGDLLDHAS